MASKDLYNVFGSNRNSGAGQMTKKKTPRPTENTHEHTSGSFGGQNMVNQLEKRDRLKQLGDAARSVGRMVIGATPGLLAESVANRISSTGKGAVAGAVAASAKPKKSVVESARSRPTNQTAASTRRVTTSNTRTATPIGDRVSAPLQNTPTGSAANISKGVPTTKGAVVKTRAGDPVASTGGAAGPKQMNPKKRSGGATR